MSWWLSLPLMRITVPHRPATLRHSHSPLHRHLQASPFADQLPTMPRSAAPATPKARLINALERC